MAIETIPVGAAPTQPVIAPDGRRVYVSNTSSQSISIIDTDTNTVVDTIAGLFGVIDIRPDSARLYVTTTPLFSFVTVIDTATNAVVSTIPINFSSDGLLFLPDGTRAYVKCRLEIFDFIETATNTLIHGVQPGTLHEGMAVSPDGTRLYTADLFSSSVSVIDISTNLVLKRIPLNDTPILTAVTPDGKRVYTATVLHAVSVIDTATNTVIDIIPLGIRSTELSGPGFIIAPAPQAPRSRNDCQNGNYLKFDPPAGRFKNQGQCIKVFEARGL